VLCIIARISSMCRTIRPRLSAKGVLKSAWRIPSWLAEAAECRGRPPSTSRKIGGLGVLPVGFILTSKKQTRVQPFFDTHGGFIASTDPAVA
jgi:hypothetical protein